MDGIRVLAGDCTVRFADDATASDTTQRGRVLAVVKPDNTVLVHDAAGYRPAAWLTRADAVRTERDGEAVSLTATKGDQRIELASTGPARTARFDVSPAGDPVGEHPDCGGRLVRDGDGVHCVACGGTWRLPRDATVRDEPCPDCGLPTIAADRGVTFRVCLDRDCDSLDRAAAERFDGEWPCPDCETGMELRRRRGLRAVCPDCERTLLVPAGTVAGTCSCGLPRFAVDGDERCLDTGCDRPPRDTAPPT
ncbi:MAG: DUF91 domain-containing protein [Halobacteriaceae archaeon]